MVGSVDAADLDTSVLLGGTLPFVGVCLFQPEPEQKNSVSALDRIGKPIDLLGHLVKKLQADL